MLCSELVNKDIKMAIRTKEELKERFKLGDRPTQQDLILVMMEQ